MTIELQRVNNSEISQKHGNAPVGTLRKIYGPSFAVGHFDTALLRDVLDRLHETSLSQLLEDHSAGRLDYKLHETAPHDAARPGR
jgi:hypothetical protein